MDSSLYKYLIRRLLMIIPTLFGITLVCFFLINTAPGGPIEQKIQQIRFGGGENSSHSGDAGVSKEVLEALKKQYGFDKPVHIRYLIWLKNIMTFDFGESFTYEEDVLDVIVSKMDISLQFGIISLFLSYLICIPLGVLKAVKSGTPLDTVSTFFLILMYSIPSFMLAILLLTFFAGGSFYNIFPLGGIYSDDYESFGLIQKVFDRIHHFILPLGCYMIGSFTTLTMLMKNSLIEEIKKDYIRTARAKGLDEKTVYLKHALKNALIPIATGIGGFLSVFFAGSLLLETIFQIDGMGQLGYTSILERDYNVIMGLIFIQSLLMVIGNLISDFCYVLVDPRIDFS